MNFREFYNHIYFDVDRPLQGLYKAKQGDTKSRGFYVTILAGSKQVPITTQSLYFYCIKPDKTKVFTQAEKDGDIFRLDFPNQVFAVPGTLKCELTLRGEDGEQISTQNFKMDVSKSLQDGSIISEDERGVIDDAFDLIGRIENIDVDELETLVTELEESEVVRESNEDTRKENEDTRISNEEVREIAESNRLDNEIIREENESGRVNNETERVSSEEERKTNENIRSENELTREDNEDIRQSNESIRTNNELARADNELVRQSNNEIVEGWIANPSQFNGRNIEFSWDGTNLGVRLEGDTEYIYVDLKGDKGDKGDTGNVENLTYQHVIDALSYTPANESDLDNKVDKTEGKGLSTEDYTTSEKDKLAGIQEGAEVNEVRQSDLEVLATKTYVDNAIDDIPEVNLTPIEDEMNNLSDGLESHKAEKATLTTEGHVQLSNAINSTSNSLAATPSAVKQAYDRADEAFTLGNSTKEGLVDKLLLVDDSLPIDYSSSWQAVINSVDDISAAGEVEPGDALWVNLDYPSYNNDRNSTPKLMKAVRIDGISGVIRTSFEIGNTSGTSRVFYGQIYINGTPKGVLRSHAQPETNYRTYVEDIEFNNGDEIQIYTYCPQGQVNLNYFAIYTKILYGIPTIVKAY